MALADALEGSASSSMYIDISRLKPYGAYVLGIFSNGRIMY